MVRPVRLLIFIGMLAAALSGPSRAQQAGAPDAYAEASSWTIGIMTGTLRETAANMASDMALALNDGPDMRIVPMIGESSIQNVTDLFHLDSVDAAIVQSDVLTHLRRTRALPGIEDDIQYIGKLHSAEFHVLSRMNYLCLAELSGRKVNFGPAGSGSSLTAQAVFEANKVQVQPQYLAHSLAAERLRKGELDAVVFVSGKPSGAFDRIRYMDGVHFLDVEFSRDLQRDYLPAIMTHDDYPDLIAPDETVSTIAVSAVLAVKKTPADSEPYAKLQRFVDRLFSRIDRFSEPPNHLKWREVALSAPVNGWTRFPAALQWLKTHPDSAAAKAGNAQRP
jgi:TRAP-type uncharacterized transport system substrate-binding protein